MRIIPRISLCRLDSPEVDVLLIFKDDNKENPFCQKKRGSGCRFFCCLELRPITVGALPIALRRTPYVSYYFSF